MRLTLTTLTGCFHPLKSGRNASLWDALTALYHVSIPSSRVGTFIVPDELVRDYEFPSPQVGSEHGSRTCATIHSAVSIPSSRVGTEAVADALAAFIEVSIPSSRVGTRGATADANEGMRFPSPQVGSEPAAPASAAPTMPRFPSPQVGSEPLDRKYVAVASVGFHPLKSGRNSFFQGHTSPTGAFPSPQVGSERLAAGWTRLMVIVVSIPSSRVGTCSWMS